MLKEWLRRWLGIDQDRGELERINRFSRDLAETISEMRTTSRGPVFDLRERLDILEQRVKEMRTQVRGLPYYGAP